MARAVNRVGESLVKLATGDDLQKILPTQWTELQDVSQQFYDAIEHLDPAYLRLETPDISLQNAVLTLKLKPDVFMLAKVLTTESRIIAQYVNGLRGEVQKAVARASELDTQLRSTNAQWQKAKLDHSNAMILKSQQHQTEVTGIKNQHQHELSRIAHEHSNQLAANSHAHEAAINDMSHQQWLMEQSHKEVVESMKQKFDDKVVELEQLIEKVDHDYSAHIDKLKLDHEAELGSKDSFINELKRTHDQDIADLTKDRDLREDRLNHRYKQEISGLSSALVARDDAYKAPLLAAEDLRRLTDEDVKAQFQEVVRLVDDVARLKWKDNQQIWDENALMKMNSAQNQRLLKKHILQDSIWYILHSYIFCSPFRCFGDEGKVFEKQWSQQSNTTDTLSRGEYAWPTPSIEVERWRYVTVKECQMALKQPLPSEFDPRAKLKKGFRANLDQLQNDLRGMLDEIVPLDKAEFQLLEQLARRASSVWLGFVMQRCRIIMIFQASKIESPIVKSDNISKGSLELDLKPRLGRYGNSKGDDLTTFVTISGCDGEVVRLP